MRPSSWIGGLAIFAFSVVVLADNFPFRAGSHRGQWCDGNLVTYTVTATATPRMWSGRLQNGETFDRIDIEQFGDGSLHIVRHLTGAYEGQTQEITTRPPAMRVFGGHAFAQFWAAHGEGPSCTERNADLRMRLAAP